MNQFFAVICALSCLMVGGAKVASAAETSPGLVIHTTEMGVGKFHRYDNKVHAYEQGNAWLPYVLPEGAATDKMLVQKNADGSYTIFFTNLEEMMTAALGISKQEHQQVSVFNVHGHGLPGAMWFPPSVADLNSWSCDSWRQASAGEDVDNYNQYYSAVPSDEIQQIHDISNNPNVNMPCTTGVKEWTAAVQNNPDFKAIFAPNAQFHFLSCVVGLGTQGENFVKGIAGLLLTTSAGAAGGRVQASMNFGLGDWSMPKGMGFWDYQSDDQLNHDNSVYPVNHRDSEIAQKGSIRMATLSDSQWTSVQLSNVDVMSLRFESSVKGTPVFEPTSILAKSSAQFPGPVPAQIRVPGTSVYLPVRQ